MAFQKGHIVQKPCYNTLYYIYNTMFPSSHYKCKRVNQVAAYYSTFYPNGATTISTLFNPQICMLSFTSFRNYSFVSKGFIVQESQPIENPTKITQDAVDDPEIFSTRKHYASLRHISKTKRHQILKELYSLFQIRDTMYPQAEELLNFKIRHNLSMKQLQYILKKARNLSKVEIQSKLIQVSKEEILYAREIIQEIGSRIRRDFAASHSPDTIENRFALTPSYSEYIKQAKQILQSYTSMSPIAIHEIIKKEMNRMLNRINSESIRNVIQTILKENPSFSPLEVREIILKRYNCPSKKMLYKLIVRERDRILLRQVTPEERQFIISIYNQGDKNRTLTEICDEIYSSFQENYGNILIRSVIFAILEGESRRQMRKQLSRQERDSIHKIFKSSIGKPFDEVKQIISQVLPGKSIPSFQLQIMHNYFLKKNQSKKVISNLDEFQATIFFKNNPEDKFVDSMNQQRLIEKSIRIKTGVNDRKVVQEFVLQHAHLKAHSPSSLTNTLHAKLPHIPKFRIHELVVSEIIKMSKVPITAEKKGIIVKQLNCVLCQIQADIPSPSIEDNSKPPFDTYFHAALQLLQCTSHAHHDFIPSTIFDSTSKIMDISNDIEEASLPSPVSNIVSKSQFLSLIDELERSLHIPRSQLHQILRQELVKILRKHLPQPLRYKIRNFVREYISRNKNEEITIAPKEITNVLMKNMNLPRRLVYSIVLDYTKGKSKSK